MRPDLALFGLVEVELILRPMRPDFRNYFLVPFFTGLRSTTWT